MVTIQIISYIAMILPTILSAIGVSLGIGKLGEKTVQALYEQPQAYKEILKSNIIGSALTETPSILGLVVSIVLIFHTGSVADPFVTQMGIIGIGIAMGVSGGIVGYLSSLPAQSTMTSLARQPFFANKLLNSMLITQTLSMTPNIFAFVISLLIQTHLYSGSGYLMAIQLLSSGLAIGLGSIGPTIGLATFGSTVCTSMGTNPKSYTQLLSFTFLCCAIIETPVIFALVIALSILNPPVESISQIKDIAFIGAALCIGLSTIAGGYSAGQIASTGATCIAQNTEISGAITRLSLIALAMIDTFAIYGLIVSMILIIFV
ncbi:hypothetical protein EBR77_01765 [bacterium]|nr:hypothetical protein [bacterium]NBX78635.1 hypothetical protein [bacterium]